MQTTFSPAPDAKRSEEVLWVAVGDAYTELAQHFIDTDDLDGFVELDARFSAAASIFDKAAVVQQIRDRLGL